MKFLGSLLVFCGISISVVAQAQNTSIPKLSPLTKVYVQQVTHADGETVAPGYIYKQLQDGKIYISAIIKVADVGTAASGLNTIGAKVNTKAGNIWTVQVPLGQTLIFTKLAGISYIQLDEPVYPKLDAARKQTKTDSAQGGYNLPLHYSGAGVIAGVIDFGFDYTHPTFYDTLGGAYRIKRVWETNGVGTPPAGYSYGKEMTDPNLIKAEGTDNAAQYHGTATTGMMAGSGFGGDATNLKYRGMAYDADIVLVSVRRDSIGGEWLQGSFSDFIDGINYIYSYAAGVHKPAVINISWGSHSGAHDGTSLINQACDNLTGPGKILVMSAGNEGQENIHMYKAFTQTDTLLKTYLTFNPTNYKRTWVDVWGETGKTFCANVTMYHNGVPGDSTGYVCLADNITNYTLHAANGTDTCTVQYIMSTAEENGKPRNTINIFNHAGDSVGIAIKAADGYINMWDEYYYYGFTNGYKSAFDSLADPSARSGNTMTTVSDMGSAQSVLLVGAYNSKGGWKNLNNGQTYSYNGVGNLYSLSTFSSHGPMIDGRIKPDIAAPGCVVVTSVNSLDTALTPTGTNAAILVSKYLSPVNNRNYYYAAFDGTSASSPAAAGIVALMLQADPTLTPQLVKNAIFATAITDPNTSVLPVAGNNNWGHGKINAYGALKYVNQHVGVYQFTGNKMDCALYPNPNSGSFTLDYMGMHDEALTVSVYDITGRLVTMKNWQVTNGLNQKQLDISSARGIYMVHIASTEGAVTIKTVVK
jgi:minor extracellular serine protease Vpr